MTHTQTCVGSRDPRNNQEQFHNDPVSEHTENEGIYSIKSTEVNLNKRWMDGKDMRPCLDP